MKCIHVCIVCQLWMKLQYLTASAWMYILRGLPKCTVSFALCEVGSSHLESRCRVMSLLAGVAVNWDTALLFLFCHNRCYRLPELVVLKQPS